MDDNGNLLTEEKTQDETQSETQDNAQKKQDQINIDMNQLKNETAQTAKQVSETLKTVDLKKDAEITKGFLLKSWKNPLSAIKEVSGNASSYLIISLLLLIVWMVAEGIYPLLSRIRNVGFNIFAINFLDTFFSMIKGVVAPLLGVAVLSVIFLILDKGKKNSLITIMTVVIVAQIPKVISSVLSFLTIIDSGASRLVGPISSLCYIISIILLYFGTKFLSNQEDDEKHVKHFILIYALYYIVCIVFRFFGIYI